MPMPAGKSDNMKRILDIPHYSQFSEAIEKDWQGRSCAIVCLKEILDSFNIEGDITEFIKEGIFVSGDLAKKEKAHEGYSPSTGWGHGVLVMLLRNHGISAYSQEFRSVDVNLESGAMENSINSEKLFNEGIKKIEKNIEDNLPVIASIRKSFTEKDSHHMVVIVGYEKNDKGEFIGFFYNDPEPKGMEGKELFVEMDKFRLGWKKFAIFVEKPLS